MNMTSWKKELIFRLICLFTATFVIIMTTALAPMGLLMARAGYYGYIEVGDGEASLKKWEWADAWKDWIIEENPPACGMPDTGITGTLQIILIITLCVSIFFLCIILRAIVKDIRSYDEEER